MRLVVFPNDLLSSIYLKGEIKSRYWNPGNIFDEIHVISLCNSDISPDKVQIMAGNAKLFLHQVGRPNYFLILFHFFKIRKLIAGLNPDVIRAHNPSLMGAFAVFAGKRKKIPVLISIHADYNPWRNIKILGWNYFPRIIRDIFSFYLIEPYSYKYASKIYAVYNFAAIEARKYRKDVEVIYNRVYEYQFSGEGASGANGNFKIISVGRHILGKNPENLIRALDGISEVELLLIGEGPLTPMLKKLVIDLNLEGKVKFISKITNAEIHNYYKQCNVFAIALEYGGVAIPEIEAMAAGLPVVISKPLWDKQPELVSECSLTVENSPVGFREAFIKLQLDFTLRKLLGENAKKRFESITGERMEISEEALYKKMINN